MNEKKVLVFTGAGLDVPRGALEPIAAAQACGVAPRRIIRGKN